LPGADQKVMPSMSVLFSVLPASESPVAMSARVRLDHHARSFTVAGPWLVKNRATSSASAASRSRLCVCGARSSSSA
jgi:hypothetical protein